MVCASYKKSVENGTVFDVMDAIVAELHGNHMEHFLHRRDKVTLGLDVMDVNYCSRTTWQPHGALPPQVG